MNLTEKLMESLGGLLPFLSHFLAGGLFLSVFAVIYLWITPYREIPLIREGKTAPAVAFLGALLGFTFPLAATISQSVDIFDMIIWAIISGVVQVLVFEGIRLLFRDLVRSIEEDRMGAAIFLSAASVCVGLLNAASMTW